MEASEIGRKLLGDVKGKLKHEWNDLDAQARTDIAAAVADLTAISLADMAGVDVAQDMAECQAAIANWSWVASSVAQRIVLDVVATAFRLAGEVIAGALT